VQFYAIRKLKNKHLLHYIAACEEDTELQAAGKKRLKEIEKITKLEKEIDVYEKMIKLANSKIAVYREEIQKHLINLDG
jgi:hypothetical protein